MSATNETSSGFIFIPVNIDQILEGLGANHAGGLKPEAFFEKLFTETMAPQGLLGRAQMGSAPDMEEVDSQLVQQFQDEIVSGFLNLGSKSGWEEGCDPIAANAFIRSTLRSYVRGGPKQVGEHHTVFQSVLKAFEANMDARFESREGQKPKLSPKPLSSRACVDHRVIGWKGHAVTRVVGKLGSRYSETAPQFEVLINSQADSPGNKLCTPFHVSIHRGQQAVDKRLSELLSYGKVSGVLARSCFYSTGLESPEKFRKEYPGTIGPNSSRILDGLVYLSQKQMQSQTAGNCWMKQPMRAMLLELFLEVLSLYPKLDLDEVWKLSAQLYLQWQKDAALPKVETLLRASAATGTKRSLATATLEARKRR